jgi:hypothetical protein
MSQCLPHSFKFIVHCHLILHNCGKKVKLLLCLSITSCRFIGYMEIKPHCFLTLVVYGGEWSACAAAVFSLKKECLWT